MHVPELSAGLFGRGHIVYVAGFPNSPLMRDAQERGLQTFTLPLKGYWHPFQIKRLSEFIKLKKIQIVHSHYSRDLWTIVPALKNFPSIPLFLTKHIGTQKAKKDIFHKKIYARVDKVLANSRVIYGNILNTHPVKRSQVDLFHIGVDTDKFKPNPAARVKIRREFAIPENALVIGIAGRLQRAKGYFEFLEMAARLSRNTAAAYFLLIGGTSRGEEGEAERIRKKADELNLGNRLIFTGFRKDLEQVLQALDIFVFPSYAEAYGLVVLEAMASGLPVVSSDCDGILDIVVAGKTGELVPPKNADELTQRVQKLIEEPDLRKKYGKNGRDRVKETFGFEKMLDKLEGYYRTNLSEKQI